MKKLLVVTGSLLIASQALTVSSSYAESKVGPEGTVLMNVYPDHLQELKAEKDKVIQLFADVQSGKASPVEANKAWEDFQKKANLVGKVKKAPTAQTGVNPEAYPSYATVYIDQFPQETSYYCGPSTAKSVLQYHSKYPTQSQLASSLKTTSAGTAWYNGGTSYPMRDTLNNYMGASYYTAYSNPSLTTLQNNLQFSISNGFPIAADVGQLAGQTHLVGHPINQEIWHWVAIDGYSGGGGYLEYVDPASGSSSISWGSTVPARSTMSTSTFQVMVNQRGIIS